MDYFHRRKGQTNKQYIKQLENHIHTLGRKIEQLNAELDTLVKKTGIVPLDQYEKVVAERNALISRLKLYSLWTGHI